jgi:multicomponent Na+:H+ antiporter subunit F
MIIQITLMILLIAITIFVVRLLVTNNIYDKLMTLNLISIKLLLFLAVYSAYKKDVYILDIILTLSLVGFIATAILITYYERNEKNG